MAENSGISWTDHTFNPWMGCTKVSPACKNCYAERDMDKRYGKVAWGPSGTRVLTSDDNWKKPVRWNREAGEKGIRYRVFCASLADVFEDWNRPIRNNQGAELRISEDGRITDCIDWTRPLTMGDVRNRLFTLIDATPNIDWLLLTKRPENIATMWPKVACDNRVCEAAKGSRVFCPHDSCDVEDGIRLAQRENVWLGTSVENQEYAEIRIPELLKLRELSPVLWLSCEPLVGAVNFERIPIHGFNLPHLDVLRKGCWTGGPFGFVNSHNAPSIDWVIAGGESGPFARPSHPDWFRSIRNHCREANVPFHFKQWGEWLPASQGGINGRLHEWDDASTVLVGTKHAGRLLDGVLHDAFPATLTAAI